MKTCSHCGGPVGIPGLSLCSRCAYNTRSSSVNVSISANTTPFDQAMEEMRKALAKIMDQHISSMMLGSYYSPQHIKQKLGVAIAMKYGNIPVIPTVHFSANDLVVTLVCGDDPTCLILVKPPIADLDSDQYEIIEEAVLAELYAYVEPENEDDDDAEP